MNLCFQECYWHDLYREVWCFQPYFQLKEERLHLNKQQNMWMFVWIEMNFWTVRICKPVLITAKFANICFFILGNLCWKSSNLIIPASRGRDTAEMELDMQSSLQFLPVIFRNLSRGGKKKGDIVSRFGQQQSCRFLMCGYMEDSLLR